MIGLRGVTRASSCIIMYGMINESLKLFGLTPDATAGDIKKAYRKLAKANHPDRFKDEAQKKKQVALMARINDAYQELLALPRKDRRVSPNHESSAVTDTDIYKKGVEICSLLNITVALKIGPKEHDIAAVNAKIEQAREAAGYFSLLLRNYPSSDWAYDAEERMKNIAKYLELLEENRVFLNTHEIGSTKKGTPVWKKK